MKFTLAILLALLPAAGAEAQMYKCTGANGKPSFSDVPCPGQVKANPSASVREEQRGPTPAQTDRRVIAANLGMREADIKTLEETCAKGLPGICSVLQEYLTKSATRMEDDAVVRARLACSQGSQASCNALALDARSQRDARGEERNALIVRAAGECADGDARACRKLSDLAAR